MTNHQKRLAAPESWPVERKTETFTVKAGAGPHGEAGVPLLIVLRDVLGYANSRKEARYALDQDNVVINGTAVSDEERPVGMFDILAFSEREEYYRVFPDEGGRLTLTPIDEGSAGSKLGKVAGKRHVPGGDVQLTLHDGQTLLVDEDTAYGVGDSLVVANDGEEVVAHFEYEEGALATAVAGQHAGRIGTIEAIQVTASSSPNNVLATDYDSGERFETVEEYIVVIDENFIDGSATEESGDEDDAESDAGDAASDAADEESSDGDGASSDAADEEPSDEDEEAAAEDGAAAENEESDIEEESSDEETAETADSDTEADT